MSREFRVDYNKSSFWYMSYKTFRKQSAVHTSCSSTGTDLTLQTATPSGTVNCGCVQSLRVACGGCVALICDKQLHGLPQNGSVEALLRSCDVP